MKSVTLDSNRSGYQVCSVTHSICTDHAAYVLIMLSGMQYSASAVHTHYM